MADHLTANGRHGPSNIHHSPEPSLMPPCKTVVGRALAPEHHHHHHHHHHHQHRSLSATHAPSQASRDGVGMALTDTPLSTAPPSPQIGARSHSSGASTPGKHRATTLDIPGLTKSKVSPDGRIAQRDVGSKLVIVMVGLPARGKSYITKKLARYLNWMQHDTKIFNVGERRRVAAGGSVPSAGRSSIFEDEIRDSVREMSISGSSSGRRDTEHEILPPAAILLNGAAVESPTPQDQDGITRDPSPMSDMPYLYPKSKPASASISSASLSPEPAIGTMRSTGAGSIDQSAQFFDPANEQAVQLREQVALLTLDELLDYILEQGGSIGILDATNSTLKRRKAIMDRIRARAGPELNVLFLESQCLDKELLESNMRLKLSGPDYRDQDPTLALEDFKKRVALYEKSYVSLGEYEEKHNMPYVQTIDVSRKVIAHQVNGFLSSQVMYYLLNFNLSPRQIWICRHGESLDNVAGRIGGDSPLSENGIRYARALTRFIGEQRQLWEQYQKSKALSTHFPPRPGDSTPPNPQYAGQNTEPRNFCIWSSMLTRSIQTVQFFDDEEYDVKQMRMLDELNAGKMEGMTYEEIRKQFPEEYANRKRQKLHYRYPGPGGEGYLDVINRLKAVIVEVERMTDNVLLVSHRSVARVLLAYFRGLKREELADLDVPLGVLYMLEPKPYGVEFKAYRYNPSTDWFDFMPNYELRQASYY
ncbi:6-phosphofructo-2-kinase [Blastomyces gilchristii SLH14081]|uniref:6-phosphofructo-2-kinase n=1 Tax=Blastomyces gilchristii (strain SLH14081) TaxID=559298 RepID=A0A179USP1_BLAGS|nr:6-phosphofructo-2-kinase [Blastomyces gilchristii SLH14081]OAT11116.1 6-phosphofructo-2-kinase [Blastomyces gilchristii SLH14081]